MFNLQNKTAIITGGASGIGLAISKLFAKQGANVHIFDLNEESLQNAKDSLTVEGLKVSCHALDISNQQLVLDTVRRISLQSQINILVNNAGIAHIGNLEGTTEEDFERIFKVNVKGTYNCLYACIPEMKKADKPVILNLASVAATVGLADRFAYSVSKGAILTMTLSIAKDYLKAGIRCNCISPARVHTAFVDGYLKKNYPGKEQEMFEKLSATQPIGRMGEPDEIAALALYLCSDEAGFVTGCDYPIDGGFTRLNT